MGFLSPWFLGGLLAVGLPIYVHLLRQHRMNPLPFSSLMFFERRTQSSTRHRRLKYLALLAMRLSILILLALMFANPFVRRYGASGDGGNKLLVIAIDNSFSMRAGDRLARAKQEAASVLAGIRSGDRGRVIVFGSDVNFLTEQVDSVSELQTAVQSIQPGDGRNSYGEITRALRTVAEDRSLPVEAHIFSDMQRSSLPVPFSELATPPGTRLVLHSVAERREPNWFVESVNAPHNIYRADRVRVLATIAGAGTEAAERTVSVSLNGKQIESRRVAVPANGRATAEFFLPDVAYGLNRGEVRLDATDTLADDNSFPFAIERNEARRVLFVHNARQARGLRYYRTGVEATPHAGFAVDAVTDGQVAGVRPDKYAFVVLSDVGSLPKEFENALNEYVKAGGAVLVALGPVAAAAGRVPVLGEKILEARYASRAEERFQQVGTVDESHPATARIGKFENVKFYQSVRVAPGQARVLARLTDQTPLVLEKKIGEGRAMVFASTLDNIANDLPIRASFVPFVVQSAQYLSGVDPASPHYTVGSHLELRSSRDAASSVDVIGPDGNRALSLKQAGTAQSYQLPRQGFYEVRRANGRHGLVAVHADRRESDLDVTPSETLTLWGNTGDASPAGAPVVDEAERPQTFWWYLALALLAAAVAESLFASRYLVAEAQPVIQKKAA